jgi:site-specific recombinase XerC
MDVLAAQEEFFAARRSLKDSPHTTAAYRRDLLAINRHLARIAEVTDVSWVKVVDVDGALLREAFGRFSADHAKSSVVRAWSTWVR